MYAIYQQSRQPSYRPPPPPPPPSSPRPTHDCALEALPSRVASHQQAIPPTIPLHQHLFELETQSTPAVPIREIYVSSSTRRRRRRRNNNNDSSDSDSDDNEDDVSELGCGDPADLPLMQMIQQEFPNLTTTEVTNTLLLHHHQQQQQRTYCPELEEEEEPPQEEPIPRVTSSSTPVHVQSENHHKQQILESYNVLRGYNSRDHTAVNNNTSGSNSSNNNNNNTSRSHLLRDLRLPPHLNTRNTRNNE